MSIIGVDLGGTNVRGGVVESSRLVRLERAEVRSRGTEPEILEDVFGVIDPLAGEGLEAIGIGVPGLVDLTQGIVYDMQNLPSWKEVTLKDILERRYRVPAFVNNDANCFAAGEKRFGAGRPYDHLVGLIVGTGLGAGIIANGRLFSGANCGAGEFGMLPYLDRNFESYASGQFFANVHGTTGREAAERAGRGDPAALAVFKEFGRHLGQAIKAVLYAADPEIIILGGSVSRSYPLFEGSMRESMADFAYPVSLSRVKIEVSTTPDIAVLGAAALCLEGPAL
jgi:glucokinase